MIKGKWWYGHVRDSVRYKEKNICFPVLARCPDKEKKKYRLDHKGKKKRKRKKGAYYLRQAPKFHFQNT